MKVSTTDIILLSIKFGLLVTKYSVDWIEDKYRQLFRIIAQLLQLWRLFVLSDSGVGPQFRDQCVFCNCTEQIVIRCILGISRHRI